MRDVETTIEVSVIIPVYNEEKYIESCIISLINQTYPREKMEWIVIDGNSTDETVKIIEKYNKEYPLKIINNPKRKTPISLNMGIRSSRGKYIIRFDAHATYSNDYIEKCIYYLENTTADNVGGYVETKADGVIGNAIARMLSTRFGVGGASFRTGNDTGYVDTVPFGAFRREVFEKVGLFDEELLRSEDNDINARIREHGGKVYLASDIVSTYYCRDSIKGVLIQGIQNGNALFRTIRRNPKAMSLRHFVPFLFLLSLVILPLLCLWWPGARNLLVAEMVLYGCIDLAFCIKKENLRYALILIWLYPIFHICYGLGSLLGLIGAELY